MPRVRNPRFAPEWLERKLSPSNVVAAPSAIVTTMTFDDPEPLPPEVPGDPPIEPITPTGPTGPG